MKALDLSVYSSPNPLSIHACEDFKRDGFGLLIVGLWTGNRGNPHALETLQNAKLAGLHIAGYIALTKYHPGGWHINQGTKYCWQLWHDLNFVAIDVELIHDESISQETIDSAYTNVLARHQQPIIYSNKNSWNTMGLPDHSFSPLWTADADKDPNIDNTYSYGGWSPAKKNIIGKQYILDTTMHGVGVDISTFRDEFILRGR